MNKLDPLATARALAPLVRELRDEGERLRHVPPAMSEALAQSGLLQMFLPRGLGGQELTPLAAFDAIEELSRADGSIGWCTMLASILTAFTGWLAPEVGRAMAGSPADLRMAGSIRPQGRARPVNGGYRIDGQWDFASGIHYARWLTCPCVIMDGDRPALTATGAPRTRIVWPPARIAPAARTASSAPPSTAPSTSVGSSSGKAVTDRASSGVPPIAKTSLRAFVAAIAP